MSKRTCAYCATILRQSNSTTTCALHAHLEPDPYDTELVHIDGPRFYEWVMENCDLFGVDDRHGNLMRNLNACKNGRRLTLWTADWMLRDLHHHITELPQSVYLERPPKKRKGIVRHTAADREAILAEAEFGNYREVAARHGIDARTLYNWRKKREAVEADDEQLVLA